MSTLHRNTEELRCVDTGAADVCLRLLTTSFTFNKVVDVSRDRWIFGLIQSLTTERGGVEAASDFHPLIRVWFVSLHCQNLIKLPGQRVGLHLLKLRVWCVRCWWDFVVASAAITWMWTAGSDVVRTLWSTSRSVFSNLRPEDTSHSTDPTRGYAPHVTSWRSRRRLYILQRDLEVRLVS